MTSKYRQTILPTLPILLAGLVAIPAHAEVTISKKSTKNMNCSAGVCRPTAKNAVLNVDELANMLTASDVKVIADKKAQDIDVVSPLTWVTTTRLTLDAFRSVAIDGARATHQVAAHRREV